MQETVGGHFSGLSVPVLCLCYALEVLYMSAVHSSSRLRLSTSSRGEAVQVQARRGPEGSRKLRFPDFVTTAPGGGRLSALRTGHLYPQEILPVLISVRG